MELDKIKGIAHTLMANRRVHAEREIGGAFYHGERVAQTVLSLRKQLLPEDASHDDILTVAAWFHDVGKGMEPHARYGAAITAEALQGCCDEESLREICALIALHPERKPSDNSYTEWARLLQDADLLDHYGTFTVWMDFLHSAYKNRSLEETFSFEEGKWDAHCKKSRGELNYAVSKRIFDEKVQFVNAFYDRLRVEGFGNIVL